MRWINIFPKLLKVAHVSQFRDEQEKSKATLYKLYENSDSISYRAVILSRLLFHRLKYFESEIAKSEQYPHEVEWEEFGSEMFDLLCMCKDTISKIITESEVMEEFLKPDHVRELRKLRELKESEK